MTLITTISVIDSYSNTLIRSCSHHYIALWYSITLIFTACNRFIFHYPHQSITILLNFTLIPSYSHTLIPSYPLETISGGHNRFRLTWQKSKTCIGFEFFENVAWWRRLNYFRFGLFLEVVSTSVWVAIVENMNRTWNFRKCWFDRTSSGSLETISGGRKRFQSHVYEKRWNPALPCWGIKV